MNIYVGNLARTVSEKMLEDAFKAFGDVTSVKIPKDRMTGMVRGFGFVEMPDKAQAEEAIARMNGYDLEGQKLRVNEAREREERPRFGGGNGGGSRGGFGGGFGGDRGGSSRGGFGGGRSRGGY